MPSVWRTEFLDKTAPAAFRSLDGAAPASRSVAVPRSISLCGETGRPLRAAAPHASAASLSADQNVAPPQRRTTCPDSCKSLAPAPSPFLRLEPAHAGDHLAAWLHPASGLRPAGLFASPACSLDGGFPDTDSLDALVVCSQSSHSSQPATRAPSESGDAPAWPINRELQAVVCQALADEGATAIDAAYLRFHGREVQQDGDWITPSMRYMTVTWMSEAVDDLSLPHSVCCAAITLLDRYLSAARAFPRSMLQLAAGTCMFVAAKVEGTLPHPPASAFVALAAGAFALDDIVLFERILCQTLGFALCAPSVHNFLTLFESTLLPPPPGAPLVAFLRSRAHHLACYFLELALCSYELLRTPRHALAAAALVLAHTDRGLLAHVADEGGVELEDVERFSHECVEAFRGQIGPEVSPAAVALACGELLRLLRVSASTLEEPFVVQKFRLPKYGCVARLCTPLTTDEFRAVMLAYAGHA